MKYLLALAMVLNLAACSKDKGSSGGLATQPLPITPAGGNSSVVIQPNDPNNDQVQVDKPDEKKPFQGMNVSINYVKAQAEIEIKKEDARRLFNRLAIASEKKGEIKIRVAKHVSCSVESCVLKLDLKEAEVIANENMGGRTSKLFPSLLTYNGENLTIHGLSKVGVVEVKGIEAQTLYEAISVQEAIGTAKNKDVMEKKGTGVAGYLCSKTLKNEKMDYKCTVKFSVVNGSVISPK